MKRSEEKIKHPVISQKLAISVISVLFGTTAAGWLLTELFPNDFNLRLAEYTARWGEFPVRICTWLKVYDPFHSFWYTGVLILFLLVLLLCLATRWRSFILRSFRPGVVGMRRDIPDGSRGTSILYIDPLGSGERRKDPLVHFARKHGIDIDEGDELKDPIYRSLSSIMKKNGFFTTRSDGDGAIFFSAVRGRWKYLGNFIFHVALVVITAGMMTGSITGVSEMVYGRKGDIIPLYKSGFSIRVEDFRILLSTGGQVGDYISTISIIDSEENVVRTAEVEVNKPFSFEGVRLYQSSYYTGDEEFSRAAVRFVHLDSSSERLILTPGKSAVSADSVFSIEAERFYPDFRMGEKGPYSATSMMRNPALEIILHADGKSVKGYLFALHPRFNAKFDRFLSIGLEDIEPVYYTGLEMTSNPGSPVLWAGMILASIGLIMLYIFDHRIINGCIGKDRIVIYAAAGNWNVGGHGKFEAIEGQIRDMLSRTVSIDL
ncbi:MAG: cytochrome c biogenesis protein ResB [Candidatus Krumholzibacteriota bacterium]|nr:cytochrome c biogenesis protein ResB [Candidatus Krumholzibacteriota bacterium]